MITQPQLPGIRSLREVMAEQAGPTRTNWKNDGRSFQKEIETTVGGYLSRRIAMLRKVDPPTRLVGTGLQRKVIFMANPFLDFVGTWTARGGRALFVECKSTQTHRLPFNSSGGLTATQWVTMKSWTLAGAVCCLVWKWNNRVVLFTPDYLKFAEARADKSLKHGNGIQVPSGQGNLTWDFLKAYDDHENPEKGNEVF